MARGDRNDGSKVPPPATSLSRLAQKTAPQRKQNQTDSSDDSDSASSESSGFMRDGSSMIRAGGPQLNQTKSKYPLLAGPRTYIQGSGN